MHWSDQKRISLVKSLHFKGILTWKPQFLTWTCLQQMYHKNDHTACLFPAAIAFLDWTPVYCMKQTGTQAKPPAACWLSLQFRKSCPKSSTLWEQVWRFSPVLLLFLHRRTCLKLFKMAIYTKIKILQYLYFNII